MGAIGGLAQIEGFIAFAGKMGGGPPCHGGFAAAVYAFKGNEEAAGYGFVDGHEVELGGGQRFVQLEFLNCYAGERNYD